ncbi:Uncharacterised protein [Chromobacterium vaccinii]|nr:Uncharacterised protein [Chromobacterium vaccinii]
MTHDLWTNLNVTIFDYLSKVSLASLVEEQHTKEQQTKESSVVQDKRDSCSSSRAAASSAL